MRGRIHDSWPRPDPGDSSDARVGRQEDAGPHVHRDRREINRAAILLVVLMWFSAVAVGRVQTRRDTAAQPTIGTASIAGVVVTDETPPQPVRRAIVTLTGDDLRPSRGAITDDDGRFTLSGLPAGRFILTAMRASFVTSLYGAKRAGRPGTPISLTDGQTQNVVVRLWRGAVIAGVLRDDTGEPVAGIPVTAERISGSGGGPALTLSNNGGVTNEPGNIESSASSPAAISSWLGPLREASRR